MRNLATLADAVLEDAVLEDAVLEDAVLEDAVLEGAVLEDAVLEEVLPDSATGSADAATEAGFIGGFVIPDTLRPLPAR